MMSCASTGTATLYPRRYTSLSKPATFASVSIEVLAKNASALSFRMQSAFDHGFEQGLVSIAGRRSIYASEQRSQPGALRPGQSTADAAFCTRAHCRRHIF